MHGAQTCTCVQSYVQGFCTCNGREVRTGGNLPGNFFSKVMTGRSALVALTASWQMFCMHLILQSKLVRHQPRSGSQYLPMQDCAGGNLSVDAPVADEMRSSCLAVDGMTLTVSAVASWNGPLPAPPLLALAPFGSVRPPTLLQTTRDSPAAPDAQASWVSRRGVSSYEPP